MNAAPVIPINCNYNKEDNTPSLINPSFEPLSVEKIRTFEGYQNLSDTEALAAVDAIRQLALILYETIKNSSPENINIIDNQEVVYLNSDTGNQNPVIAFRTKLKIKTA